MTTMKMLENLDHDSVKSILQEMIEDLGSVGLEAYEKAYNKVKNPVKAVIKATEGDINEQRNNKNTQKPPKKQKVFDLTRYRQRHIAFQIQYDGSKYSGFALQETEDTVEHHLFTALKKLNLIEDRKACNYSRCGRTDKGVSALGQVIALRIRSIIATTVPDNELSNHKEMDYCTMLNRALPEDVRILGWTPVTDDFSSRFSATYRTYRYFFLKNDLNINKMQEAVQYLLGEHDFRNFCKMDVVNVSNFRREIFSAEIKLFEHQNMNTNIHTSSIHGNDDKELVYMLELKGIAFLWHMVRCIMAVLLLVGEEKEDPTIVLHLLDVENNPRKPSYSMAADHPLVLHECGFENLRLQFTAKNLWHLSTHYYMLYERHMIAALRAKNSLQSILHDCQIDIESKEQFLDELTQTNIRAMKKLSNKGIILPKTSSQNGENIDNICGQKRKLTNEDGRIEKNSSNDANNNDTTEVSMKVKWWDVLQEIENKLSISPYQNNNHLPLMNTTSASHSQAATIHSNNYIPLLQRKREETYEEKLQNLVGNKKNRHIRHATLTKENEEENDESLKNTSTNHNNSADFFRHMRQQGSL